MDPDPASAATTPATPGTGRERLNGGSAEHDIADIGK